MHYESLLPPRADESPELSKNTDRRFSTALPYHDYARFESDATARRITVYKLAKIILIGYTQGDLIPVANIKRYLIESNPALLDQIIKDYQAKQWQENQTN